MAISTLRGRHVIFHAAVAKLSAGPCVLMHVFQHSASAKSAFENQKSDGLDDPCNCSLSLHCSIIVPSVFGLGSIPDRNKVCFLQQTVLC
mmetsp:Transcript_24668/g.40330  ORF Transcript_24668/g.40330 Transcript_24668/m.40330 type:complete len:90 (-) Transcript_24668:274-543(-)